MAQEKIIYSRQQQKHDIEANWIKAVNFIPKEGEIIVYDAENATTDLTGTDRTAPIPYSRIKIGDGITVVSLLSFTKGENEVYIGSDEMPEGYVLQINPEGDALNLDNFITEEELTNEVETIISNDYEVAGPIWGIMDSTAQNAASIILREELSDALNEDYEQEGEATALINSIAREYADVISKENIDITIINQQLVSALSADNRLIYSDPETSDIHQVTPEQVGAAPAGYGFGEREAQAMNWNSHYRSGIYKERANSPDGATFWYGLTCVSYYGESADLVFNPDETNGFTMAVRHKKNNTHQAWEYVNPPMLEGVEYRTIERFNGKPVYIKLINSDTLNIPGTTNIIFSDESVNIIEIKGYLTRNNDNGYFPLPYVYNGNICAYIYAGYTTEAGNTIGVITTTENIATIVAGSTYNAHITVKYTKNEETQEINVVEEVVE